MDEACEKIFPVEVAYATPERQQILTCHVKEGTSVTDAVRQSGIVEHFPCIELISAKMGIFGKIVSKPMEQKVRKGDRIEIYRPLIADPREVRKRRAAQVKLKQQI